MNRSGRWVTVFFVTTILIFGVCASAIAKQAWLTNIVLTDTHDALRLYLAVEGPFSTKLEETLHSGLPVTFSFSIKLYQRRGFWPKKKVVDIFLSHTAKYNSLKKTYVISRSWDEKTPVTVYSVDAARKLMTEIDGIDVIALARLERNRRYQIQTQATLERVTLPYHLHHVLFFLSLWNVETDWYTIDFIY